ncbi:MAG: competence/damage-inducible protein A [Alphaproteobacteria bacterium]|nr:MAG: competence/damage-inducible protein A [Alphaproteobacteria bacterium]
MGRSGVSAGLVVIGDEILSGRTRDANIAHIGRWLSERGVTLAEVRIVPDETEMIVEAVNALRTRYTHLFTTGGIGPTHDDITAESIARAFGRSLVFHPEAWRRLEEHYGTEHFTPARQRMARVPEGAELIDNPISIAPGFRLENVFVLAGVPEIARAMLDSLGHLIVGGKPMRSLVLDIPLPESAFAGPLAEIAAAAAKTGVRIGSYPYYRDGRAGAEIVLRGTDRSSLEKTAVRIEAAAREAGVSVRRLER